MLSQPIDRLLARPRRVLVAGIGGGFDVVCALPLVLRLEEAGHHVVLANLTFTDTAEVEGGEWVGETTLRVDARSRSSRAYFPEGYLARWFEEARGREVGIHLFRQEGLPALATAYRELVAREEIDLLLQVDGGIDGLLRGDEYSLGTPTWDALSLAAARDLPVEDGVVAFVGFGAERHDRISHTEALARFADLTRAGALLGVEALLAGSPEGAAFLEALEFVHRPQGSAKHSIVASTIREAMRGRFGDTVVNARTRQTPIWVSPLAHLVWFVEHGALLARKPYLEDLLATNTVQEASAVIQAYHQAHGRPAPVDFPI